MSTQAAAQPASATTVPTRTGLLIIGASQSGVQLAVSLRALGFDEHITLLGDEDHRPYQFGDDLRRVDPHLFARFGEAFVRQYNVTQRLNVTLLLDASRSMASGVPSKMRMAARIAQGLAFVALAGSDLVQVGVLLQRQAPGVAQLLQDHG